MAAHNMMHPARPFVGRVTELAEITNRLNNSDCCLLTLVGAGGIGKTRLAIQVAANCADQFDDGVYFVPLQPLDSSEFIISTMADAVGFQLRLGGDPKQQLLQYLHEKVLLLVLDNFEHMLDQSELLIEILQAAPGIKLLVTSREVLNLQEEWLYPIRGLDYPKTDDSEQLEAYSAVQLFIVRARQVRGELSLADEMAGIIRICQLVEGVPLAIELAASWTKTLPSKAIAIEIQRNLDFLTNSLRNVPKRHQSMLAVFETTWQRLTNEERRVFITLSVFRGGFRPEAAEAVANVSMRILSGLADKSLLMSELDGRYQIHELLRQYAEAQPITTPEEAIHVYDLHSAYYAQFMYERDPDLNGGRQREVSLEIEGDLDNIRAAWLWAIDHSRVENIDKSEHPLLMFYQFQSRFLEGADVFEKAADMLDNGDAEREISLAKVLCSLGWLYIRLGTIEQAKAALERSWFLFSQHAILPTSGRGTDPRLPLGLVYVLLGNFGIAERLGQDTFRDHTLRKDLFNLSFSCYLLANAARVQGKYEEARQYAQQAYTHAAASGDNFFTAYCLHEWGTVSRILGDLAEAKRRFQASYAIRKDFGDPQGMAVTLNNLGRIAFLQGNNSEARQCYEQALTLYHDIGDKGGLATSLEGLGNSARELGHYGEARRYLREALKIAGDRIVSLTLSIYIGIGELLLQTEQHARGIELLALTLHHPVSDHDTKDRAQRLLTRYQATTEAMQPGSIEDFYAITTALLEELLIPDDMTLTSHASQVDWALVEPLSEREMAVLHLVADGLSNREVADRLFLSVATVKWHITHIYSKLSVESRTQAIMRARQINLLP